MQFSTPTWSPEAEVRLLQSLALSIGEAEDLHGALLVALQEISRATGWAAGEAWLPSRSGETFARGPAWSDSAPAVEKFLTTSEADSFRRGEGLVGLVWSTGEPVWTSDVTRDPGFRRAVAARVAALRTAVAIPVLAGREVAAVLVFFHFEARPHDTGLIGLVGAVAAQLGMLVRRKRAEDELARRALELSLANEELERFIWLASHDLNEPLRMVTLYTQWLAERLRGQLGPSEEEAIGFAVEGARRIHDLLEDFRAYAEAGSRAGEVGRVALDRVLAQALSGLGPQILAEGAVVLGQPLPEVMGRAPELCRVFQQLILNGLTFRRPDVVPRIEIGAEPLEDAWVITVSDNGIGIEPDQLSKVFDAFHRGAPRDVHPGNGIGLAICRKIIQRAGGRLWVESEPGRGSRFSFTLPSSDEAPLRRRPGAAIPRR